MALIKRLPVRPIKADVQHAKSVKIIEELMGGALDSGAGDYLDTLILLVKKYEDDHQTPEGFDLSLPEALTAIMEANGMPQADIGNIIGSESAVSMFLRGERALSKARIKALVARFRVDASAFL
jgi:HTH-type transcriptional regulator/antitoxin HigA